MKNEVYQNEGFALNDIFFIAIYRNVDLHLNRDCIRYVHNLKIIWMIEKSQRSDNTPPSKRQRGRQQKCEKEVPHQVLSQGSRLKDPPKREADQFESQSEVMKEQEIMKAQKKQLQRDRIQIEKFIRQSEKGLFDIRQQYKSQEEKQFQFQLQKTRIENLIRLQQKEDLRLQKKAAMSQQDKNEISREVKRICQMQIKLIEMEMEMEMKKKLKQKINQIQNLLNEKKVQQFQLQYKLKNAKNEEKEEIQLQLFKLSLIVKKLEVEWKDIDKKRLQIQKTYEEKKEDAIDQKQSGLSRLAECFSLGINIRLTNGQHIQSTRFFPKYLDLQDYHQQLQEIQKFLQKKQRWSKKIKRQEKRLTIFKQDYQTTKNKLKQVDTKIISLSKKLPIKAREQQPPTIQPTTNRYVLNN